jgi:hypothetical protein
MVSVHFKSQSVYWATPKAVYDELDKPNIVLYSHWGETSWREDLAIAIDKAKPRIASGDIPYATRIIIDQLTKDGRDSETGYGILLATDEEIRDGFFDFPVHIDMTTQMVNDDGHWHSFESFIEYISEVIAYHE